MPLPPTYSGTKERSQISIVRITRQVHLYGLNFLVEVASKRVLDFITVELKVNCITDKTKILSGGRLIEQGFRLPTINIRVLGFTQCNKLTEVEAREVYIKLTQTIRSSLEYYKTSMVEQVRGSDQAAEYFTRYDQMTGLEVNNLFQGIMWGILLQNQVLPNDVFRNVLQNEMNVTKFNHIGFMDTADDIPELDPVATTGALRGDHTIKTEADIRREIAAEIRRIRWVEEEKKQEENRLIQELRWQQNAQAVIHEQIQANKERMRPKLVTNADHQAMILLGKVVGQEVANEFLDTGVVLVQREGYTFKIHARAFIEVLDPAGKTANLCIHSQQFCCNFVDEVVIAYLNIKNNFEEYINTANIFASPGFKKFPERKR